LDLDGTTRCINRVTGVITAPLLADGNLLLGPIVHVPCQFLNVDLLLNQVIGTVGQVIPLVDGILCQKNGLLLDINIFDTVNSILCDVTSILPVSSLTSTGLPILGNTFTGSCILPPLTSLPFLPLNLLYNIQARDSAGQVVDAGRQIQVCQTQWVSTPPLLAVRLGDNLLGTITLISNLGVFVEVDFGDGNIEVVLAVRNVLTGLLHINLFHNYASVGNYHVSLKATCECGGQNMTDIANLSVTVAGSCGTISAPSGPIAEGESFKMVFVPSNALSNVQFTASANFTLNGDVVSVQDQASFEGVNIFAYKYGNGGSASVSVVVTALTNGVADPNVCIQTYTAPFVVQGVAPIVWCKPLGLLTIGSALTISGGFRDPGFGQQFEIAVFLNSIKVNCDCRIVKVTNTDYAYACPIRQYLLLGVANIRVVVHEKTIGGLSGSAYTSGLVLGLSNLLNNLGLNLGLNI
jgi:hypothetical protein